MSELVRLGHDKAAQFKSSGGAVSQLISDLATQLDVQLSRGNALAAENAGLKDAAEFATASDMWEELGGNVMRYQYQEWYADRLKSAMKTPATDAFLAEVRASAIKDALKSLDGVFDNDCVMESNNISYEDAEQRTAGAYAVSKALEEFADQVRKGVQS
ncbi:hypothetical protein LE121_00890 [Escherichia coli]|nr:hypothetical protein [Escherichia coli]